MNLPIPPNAPMTVDQSIKHHIGPSTLSKYLSCLSTVACYIPTCLMLHFGQTDPTHLQLYTQQYTLMTTNQNINTVVPIHLPHCCMHTDAITWQTRTWTHHASNCQWCLMTIIWQSSSNSTWSPTRLPPDIQNPQSGTHTQTDKKWTIMTIQMTSLHWRNDWNKQECWAATKVSMTIKNWTIENIPDEPPEGS